MCHPLCASHADRIQAPAGTQPLVLSCAHLAQENPNERQQARARLPKGSSAHYTEGDSRETLPGTTEMAISISISPYHGLRDRQPGNATVGLPPGSARAPGAPPSLHGTGMVALGTGAQGGHRAPLCGRGDGTGQPHAAERGDPRGSGATGPPPAAPAAVAPAHPGSRRRRRGGERLLFSLIVVFAER